jgi:hypothetical protein
MMRWWCMQTWIFDKQRALIARPERKRLHGRGENNIKMDIKDME